MKVGPQARSEAETVGVCESPHTTAREAHLGIYMLYNNNSNNNTRESQLQGKLDLTASRLYHAITAEQAWHAPKHAVSCRPTSKKATWHPGPAVGLACDEARQLATFGRPNFRCPNFRRTIPSRHNQWESKRKRLLERTASFRCVEKLILRKLPDGQKNLVFGYYCIGSGDKMNASQVNLLGKEARPTITCIVDKQENSAQASTVPVHSYTTETEISLRVQVADFLGLDGGSKKHISP
ncbi:uncharacterized protein BO95DRAFT_461757 [Aspergillus brunneoviolaceus CBS 621.78]|uniref:Uncharacterized protein n=1 Tax=Aspergillus brunneoviolaceus CBS 621.78 TaxID=1450534 RepID=A0ACD1GEP4_9EURO|nr:hypothetical protein BO95DRAFT_461757 [Aspergillus brunneoviolaceus CBS 621.78]RAH47687.1 hypothetical protein BO95DRAFT_461757 [Aspergillus brunneoviolaceus CBS 621.78]